jgi:hypothetical protein
MATAVHKKQSESKYVSCFADSRPDVDITFRDVLLSRPTDHYLVGVDNFSMTNTTLSMIEPGTGHYDAFIRIVRNPSDLIVNPAGAVPASAHDLDQHFQNAPITIANMCYVTDNDFDLSIKSSEVILSMQQLMHRLGNVAADVNEYMHRGLAVANAFQLGGYTAGMDPATGAYEDYEHLKFSVATDGRITVKGTHAFWNCFSIEVPAVRNQFGIYGARKSTDLMVPYTQSRRFLSVHPEDGTVRYNKLLINRFAKTVPTVKNVGETQLQFTVRLNEIHHYNSRTLQGSIPFAAAVTTVVADATSFNTVNDARSRLTHSVTLGASVFSSLERRIALEVGCSLPIKNSPMIDHQKESPDFVLARWIWRTDPRIESNEYGGSRRYHSNMPACTEYQGAQDRISYHELQAQSKIQTLRIKLFARLRTFDELKETWGMRVIELPTSPTDWWHTRLHFMSAD